MVDCTFGGGGHSIKLLSEHPKNLKILGTDLDESMIEHCSNEYEQLIRKKKLALVHSNYANLPLINLNHSFNLKSAVKKKFDIALLDLGFSSYQLEDENRGFSYLHEDQDLDMRYDCSDNDSSTAPDIINNLTLFDLKEIF